MVINWRTLLSKSIVNLLNLITAYILYSTGESRG
jgi:hypothetical protein